MLVGRVDGAHCVVSDAGGGLVRWAMPPDPRVSATLASDDPRLARLLRAFVANDLIVSPDEGLVRWPASGLRLDGEVHLERG